MGLSLPGAVFQIRLCSSSGGKESHLVLRKELQKSRKKKSCIPSSGEGRLTVAWGHVKEKLGCLGNCGGVGCM
jgi:hypothetical protein